VVSPSSPPQAATNVVAAIIAAKARPVLCRIM
jgi:hypothetical protein